MYERGMMVGGVVERALSSWGCKILYVDFRNSFLVALVMNMLRLFSGQADLLYPTRWTPPPWHMTTKAAVPATARAGTLPSQVTRRKACRTERGYVMLAMLP